MKSFHSISAGLITASIAISVNAAFSDLLGTALHAAALRPLLFTLMMAACCLAMLLVAGNSRLKLAIPGLDEPAMVILSALVSASSLHLLTRPWSTGQVLSTLLCINALTALLTAAAFLLAARLRAGQLARCLPYPVLAAFMASSGLLLIVFGLSIAAGHSLSLTQPASWQLDGGQATQLGWGLGFGILLLLCMRKMDHPATLTALLLLACLCGPTLSSAVQPQSATLLPSLQLPIWSAVLGALPSALAAALMAMLGSTSNIMALDQAQLARADLNQEMRVNGLACLASALCATPPVSIMLSDSLLAGRMGARRWPLAICFVTCCLLAIWQQQWMLGLIQPYVLGGVLLYFGVELLTHWLQRWPALGRAERAILLSTMLTFLTLNVLSGIVVGLVLSAWQFCYRASQQNPLQDIRLQPADELDQRPAVLTAELGGPLYFGSVSHLHDQLQAAIAAQLSSGGLVQLCLRQASLDSSAMQTLHRLRLWCDEHGYRLQLLCQDEATASQLQRWGLSASCPHHALHAPKRVTARQHQAEPTGIAHPAQPRFIHFMQTGRE
ncbi:SulP family inorganic anion transporter [Aquitalea sp. LB_tupeE]|uniref:SulP family inorganic anion transporter n=1 Tax=Aquitalea sp. LB_tupeE TaxID=2748078 RepID=UPI0015B98AC7|nr:SulP family inorganic anion transporter [Aquitalea sp. LB_tupeE]NWK76989.1 SulP family inorganic anion transporter [Aquitalea sp. LB_tupeE]